MRTDFSNKANSIISQQDLKRTSVRILYWGLFVFLIIISLVCLLPVIWIIISSFKDLKEFYSAPPTIIPRSFHPEKLIQVSKELDIITNYANSLILAVGEIFCCVFFNGFFGYGLSRLRPKGHKALFSIILWTMMIPGSVSMVPLYKTFVDVPYLHLNFMNTYIPMFLMAGANAFNILLFKNYFDTIPSALVDAAKIDGCSDIKTFFKIIIPLSLPIVAVVSLFTFNAAWNNFMWPYILLRKSSLYPVTIRLFQLKQSGTSMDKYFIMILMSMLPPFIVYILFHKHIMNGINIGGVKG